MEETTTPAPAWKPISSVERRVLGVLVEKAKTTPDAYPLTLNALRNGCNQKSNRDPQMDVNEDQLEDALEDLRRAGAVMEIQGDGRAAKYRHAIYEWMGVSKVEAAVMTELLLRGAQTMGELRGRAARMEPIPDLAALKPVVDALKARGLVMGLTPAGRGHVVTHTLYPEKEMERVRRDHGQGDHGGAAPNTPATPTPVTPSSPPASASTPQTAPASSLGLEVEEASKLENELEQLRAEFSATQRQLEETIADLQQRVDDLERFRQSVEG